MAHKFFDQFQTFENIEQEKAYALAEFLKLEAQPDDTLDSFLSQLVSTEYDKNRFEINGEEYLVLTDREADEAQEEYIDNYIDECILHGIPENYRFYFDSELWKRDAKINSSRGNDLAMYDGEENEQETNGTTYYIYRTN